MKPSTCTLVPLILLMAVLFLPSGAVSAAVFTDDFTSGLGNWNPYGSPAPVILPGFGGRAGVVDNNGDSNCDSGIATKNIFSLTGGGVITSDVYLEISDWAGCWGSAEVSITRDTNPYQTPSCPGEGYYDGATISLVGIGDACWATPAQYRRHAYVQCSILAEDGTSEGNGYSFPADGYTNGWHTLRMVVDPDRYLSCFIDDTLVYQTQKKIDPEVLQDKRIQLGRRSSGSIGKAYHDDVIVEVNQVLAAAATPVQPANQAMMFRANPQHTGDYSSFSGGIIPDGQLKWSFTIDPGERSLGPGEVSSPAVVDGVVYIASHGVNIQNDKVYAIDASTGVKKWEFRTGGYAHNSPAVADGVVFTDSDGELHAIDAGSGIQRWVFKTRNPMDEFGSPTVVNGVVYTGSAGYSESAVHAIDAVTGTQKWAFVLPGVAAGIFVMSSPAVANGRVYIGADNGRLYALDAATGTEIWNFSNLYQVQSYPAVVDGVVYVGSDQLYALDAATGTLKWNVTLGGPGFYPAVAEGVVYVGDVSNHLYSVDSATGNLKWIFFKGSAPQMAELSPAIADGIVYFEGGDGNFYAIDAATGIQKWAFSKGGRIGSSPAVADGVVYLGSTDGNLYAIGTGGDPVSPIPLKKPLASEVIPPEYLPAAAIASGIGLTAAGAAVQGLSGAGGATAAGGSGSAGGTTPGSGPNGWLSRLVDRMRDLLVRFFRVRALATVGAKETQYRRLEPVLRPPVFLGLSARELATVGVSVVLYAGAFVIAGRLLTGLQSVALFLAMGTFAVLCHELVTIRLARYHAVRSEFRFWGLGSGILIGNAAVFGLAFGTPSRTLLKGLEALRPLEEITIMAAGPLVNLLFAVVSFLMIPLGGILGLAGAVGFPVNILNAVFSMIPIAPLKGKVIYRCNRLIWAAIFLPIIALYSIVYLVP